MATENVVISQEGWQELSASFSFTSGNTYTITLLGGVGEICISSSTPAAGLLGHPITDGQNFAFTSSGDDVYIKVAPYNNKAVVVIS